MNALTYSNSVLKEIEATLSNKSRQQEMTSQEMKEIFNKALNAKQNYLNKADERKKNKEEMQQVIKNVQKRMLDYKKSKESRQVGEVVGGKNKRTQTKQKKYEDYTLVELKEKAAKRNIKGYSTMKKSKLINILRK